MNGSWWMASRRASSERTRQLATGATAWTGNSLWQFATPVLMATVELKYTVPGSVLCESVWAGKVWLECDTKMVERPAGRPVSKRSDGTLIRELLLWWSSFFEIYSTSSNCFLWSFIMFTFVRFISNSPYLLLIYSLLLCYYHTAAICGFCGCRLGGLARKSTSSVVRNVFR